MQKWEYRVLKYRITEKVVNLAQLDEKALDQLGHDGWELVSCIPTTGTHRNAETVLMCFKKPVKTIASKRIEQSEDDLPDLKTREEVIVKLDETITRFLLIKEDGSEEEVDKVQYDRYLQMYAKRHPDEKPKVNISIGGKPFTVNQDTKSTIDKSSNINEE